MRTEEWIERKNMKADETEIENYKINVTKMNLEEHMKISDKVTVEKFYLENFNKQIEDLEKTFLQDVDQFFADTKTRQGKKKTKK